MPQCNLPFISINSVTGLCTIHPMFFLPMYFFLYDQTSFFSLVIQSPSSSIFSIYSTTTGCPQTGMGKRKFIAQCFLSCDRVDGIMSSRLDGRCSCPPWFSIPAFLDVPNAPVLSSSSSFFKHMFRVNVQSIDMAGYINLPMTHIYIYI